MQQASVFYSWQQNLQLQAWQRLRCPMPNGTWTDSGGVRPLAPGWWPDVGPVGLGCRWPAGPRLGCMTMEGDSCLVTDQVWSGVITAQQSAQQESSSTATGTEHSSYPCRDAVRLHIVASAVTLPGKPGCLSNSSSCCLSWGLPAQHSNASHPLQPAGGPYCSARWPPDPHPGVQHTELHVGRHHPLDVAHVPVEPTAASCGWNL